jgi:hypothetical protein
VVSLAADAGLASQLWLRCLAVVLLLLFVAVHWPDGGTDGSGAKVGRPGPDGRGLQEASSRKEADASRGAAAAAPVSADDRGVLGWRYFCCGAAVRGEVDREETSVAPLEVGPLHLAARGSDMHPKFCGLRLEEPTGRIPDLRRFPARAPEVPDWWDKRLPCDEQERADCRKLRSRLSGETGPKDLVTMLRYLRARKGDVDAAASMYRISMKWREDTLLESGFRDGTIDDSLHQRFSSYWPPIGLMGRDKEGDAIYWIRVGAAEIGSLLEPPMEFLYRHEVFTLTRIVQALEELSQRQMTSQPLGRPVLYMTVVVDCSDLTLKHVSPKAALKYKQIVRLAEDYYPEMIKRVLVVRAPWFFNQGWSVVSRFFDEGTRNKFSVVKTAQTREALAKVMDEHWIPQELGGPCRLGSHRFCAPVIPEGGEAPKELLQKICSEFPVP